MRLALGALLLLSACRVYPTPDPSQCRSGNAGGVSVKRAELAEDGGEHE